MRKLFSGFVAAALVTPVFAAEVSTNFIQVGYLTGEEAVKENELVPVLLMINDLKPQNAWLNVASGFEFLFPAQTQTTLDLAHALKSLKPALIIRFDCDTNKLSLCERYTYFKISYDYDTGRMIVLYELRDQSFVTVESEPAMRIRQALSYSESAGSGGKYTSGSWSGDIGLGVSADARLLGGVRSNLNKSKMETSHIRYEYDFPDGLVGSLSQSRVSDDQMSLLNVDRINSISLDWSRSAISAKSEREPLMLDVSLDSLINIYDINRVLVLSVRAPRLSLLKKREFNCFNYNLYYIFSLRYNIHRY